MENLMSKDNWIQHLIYLLVECYTKHKYNIIYNNKFTASPMKVYFTQ